MGKKKKKKLRKFGEISSDLEKILQEMLYDHDMQRGEIFYHILGWFEIHAPESKETYTADNTNPEFKYGPQLKL